MIPSSIIKLFWDFDTQALDIEKNKKTIISRTINYGTLSDWKWLKENYGKSAIIEVALSTNRIGIREGAKRLVKIIFS